MKETLCGVCLALAALSGCSSDDSGGAITKSTCQTICDCECGGDGTCVSECNKSCATFTTACQDCTLNVGCEALKGVLGPAPQCSSECSKTKCQTICDCECGSDTTCVSECNKSCSGYSAACQECTLNVGCDALKSVKGPAPQCSSQCQ